MIRNIWRSIWFMDDDDKTPQGKLARGTFYLIYAFMLFLFMFGFVTPMIDYACSGCLGEIR